MQLKKTGAGFKPGGAVRPSLQPIDGGLGDRNPKALQLIDNTLLGQAIGADEVLDDFCGGGHQPSLYGRGTMSIRSRMESCELASGLETDGRMASSTYTFREVLEAACKSHPDLWRESKTGTAALNLAAVERHYRRKGYPVTQPNLHRLLYGGQKPGPHVVDATHAVFGVPRAILRGEPLSHDMERLLGKTKLETVILAERIEELDHDDRRQLLELLEHMEEKREQLHKAISSSPNVHPLPKR